MIGNKEPCAALSLIEFEGRRWIFYRSDTPGPIMKSKVYGVLTEAEGGLVAIMIEAGGWFIPRRLVKLHRPVSDIFLALLMATFHGLVFRRG